VSTAKFPLHGYVGAAGIVVAEVLLFGGNIFVGHWFTPIVWTAYILLVDALVYRVKGRSLLKNDRLEFLVVVIISIASWWLFELYNAPRFWNSKLELWWHYHNLEPNLWLRRIGYDWAFATITPALLETAELFRAMIFKNQRSRARIDVPTIVLIILIVLGGAGVLIPLITPSPWFAPIVWLSFIFVVDPINFLRGGPSITGDVGRRDYRRLWSLLASGLVCGFLWEFWNYWALSKWTYTVPYFGHLKIFEMPVLGYFGFPPFAVECWVIYIFVRSLLRTNRPTQGSDIFLRTS